MHFDKEELWTNEVNRLNTQVFALRARIKKLECVECDNCGFRYGIEHAGSGCASCQCDDLRKEIERLREENERLRQLRVREEAGDFKFAGSCNTDELEAEQIGEE